MIKSLLQLQILSNSKDNSIVTPDKIILFMDIKLLPTYYTEATDCTSNVLHWEKLLKNYV